MEFFVFSQEKLINRADICKKCVTPQKKCAIPQIFFGDSKTLAYYDETGLFDMIR
jgi:hypothetical protein